MNFRNNSFEKSLMSEALLNYFCENKVLQRNLSTLTLSKVSFSKKKLIDFRF